MPLGKLSFAVAVTMLAAAQSAPPEPAFDVASVKPSKSGDSPTSNFPLGAGDVYVRNGGYFNATAQPLAVYLNFAYKVMGNQAQYIIPQLPDWATTDRYDIQARAQADPGKDGMRLMMRALLAERFHLKTHYEDRELPVFALVLRKPGKLGPQLVPHEGQEPCPTEQPAPNASWVVDGKLAFCNGIFPMQPSVPRRYKFAGRNLTLGFIMDTFSAGVNLGRPIVDRTGLTGTFDFSLEWAPDRPTAEPELDAGPTFEQALRDQFGMQLQPQKGPVKILVIDHVERPSAN